MGLGLKVLITFGFGVGRIKLNASAVLLVAVLFAGLGLTTNISTKKVRVPSVPQPCFGCVAHGFAASRLGSIQAPSVRVSLEGLKAVRTISNTTP